MSHHRHVLVAAVLLAFVPAAAHATTYCVSKPSCVSAGGTAAAWPAVISNVDANPDADRIEFGPGTFDAPSTSILFEQVDLVGAGSDQTILTNSNSTAVILQLAAPSSTVSDLFLQLTPTQSGLVMAGAGDTADRVKIAEATGTFGFGTGVQMNGPGPMAFRNGTIVLSGGGATGVQTYGSGTGASAKTVFGSVITTGNTSIQTEADETVISRSRVSGFLAVRNPGKNPGVALAAVRNSILGVGFDNGTAVFTSPGGSNYRAATTVDHVTIDGRGHASTVGVYVALGSGDAASLTVDNTIVNRTTTPTLATGGTFAMTYSDFPGASCTGCVSGDPKFVDIANGDYRLRYDSAALDLGDPDVGEVVDLVGTLRPLDGNNDGTARRDMGAYEYLGHAPTVSASVPATATTGQAVTFSATGGDEDPGEGVTYSWSFDDGGSGTGASVEHAFSTVGAHTGTVTATDPTNRAGTAQASVTVTAPSNGGGGSGGGGSGGGGGGGSGGGGGGGGGGSADTPCGIVKRGTPKRDLLTGTAKGDRLLGLGGNDTLKGLAGIDCLVGGPGNDVLVGGPGNDDIKGGPGRDRIDAADGEFDNVDCGPGRDRVKADRRDRLRHCERRTRV